MSIREEIGNAIVAHGQWKIKLRVAINTGQCESTPDKVKMDDNCSFGKWLHHRMVSSDKGAYYKEVVDLHAKFHREAGDILEIALNGDREEADKRTASGSTFHTLTTNLTNKLRDWEQSL